MSALFEQMTSLMRAHDELVAEERMWRDMAEDPEYFALGVWRAGYGLVVSPDSMCRCTGCGHVLEAECLSAPFSKVVWALPITEAGLCGACLWEMPLTAAEVFTSADLTEQIS